MSNYRPAPAPRSGDCGGCALIGLPALCESHKCGPDEIFVSIHDEALALAVFFYLAEDGVNDFDTPQDAAVWLVANYGEQE